MRNGPVVHPSMPGETASARPRGDSRWAPSMQLGKNHVVPRSAADGTWDRSLSELGADADAAGDVDRVGSVGSAINRAHQQAANTRITAVPETAGDTGRMTTTRPSIPGRTGGGRGSPEATDHGPGHSRGGWTASTFRLGPPLRRIRSRVDEGR